MGKIEVFKVDFSLPLPKSDCMHALYTNANMYGKSVLVEIRKPRKALVPVKPK